MGNTLNCVTSPLKSLTIWHTVRHQMYKNNDKEIYSQSIEALLVRNQSRIRRLYILNYISEKMFGMICEKLDLTELLINCEYLSLTSILKLKSQKHLISLSLSHLDISSDELCGYKSNGIEIKVRSLRLMLCGFKTKKFMVFMNLFANIKKLDLSYISLYCDYNTEYVRNVYDCVQCNNQCLNALTAIKTIETLDIFRSFGPQFWHSLKNFENLCSIKASDVDCDDSKKLFKDIIRIAKRRPKKWLTIELIEYRNYNKSRGRSLDPKAFNDIKVMFQTNVVFKYENLNMKGFQGYERPCHAFL